MRKQLTAFYMETLLLLAAFMAIVLVLVSVFGGARQQSTQAAQLTHAVRLAENAAEAVASVDSVDALQELLSQEGSTRLDGGVLTVLYDDYELAITWEPEGALVNNAITVSRNGEEIYTLETAVYIRKN